MMGGGPGFNRGGNNFNSGGSNSGGNGNFGGMNDRNFNGNMNNGGNNGNGPYLVHMRGMPFDCGEMEIHQFFAPLKLVDCQVIFNNNGRHTGEADAWFATVADAQEAMKKHKEKMGTRYIELFANRNERRGRF
jgi:heterogeneous nuclear ribonucleoprotein F/H